MIYPRLSWTTLQMIEECPQRYLLHKQRRRSPIPERYVLVGNVMHYASEQLILGVNPIQAVVSDSLADFDRRVLESTALGWNEQEMTEKREQVEPGVWRLAEIYDDEFASLDRGDLRAEVHLFRFFPGWAIEGYMDVAQMAHGQRFIEKVYDVKTGSSHKVGQLQFYSVLIEAYQGERPEGFAWIEPLGRGLVRVTVTDDEHEEMKQRIKRAVLEVVKGEFPTDGFPSKCSRCPSETFCPALDGARNFKLS